ncbi:MAG: glycosyltransferase family 39 protein, partial [Proteobacteria bacterium]|nr:glycosyltransferase family 39 protein [Pseudomonadota bacterium]
MTRWTTALVVVLLLGFVMLIPGLGRVGFWEPQERQLVDRIAPREALATKKAAELAKQKAAAPLSTKAPVDEACPKQAKDGALARSLQTRAPAFGRDSFGDSDAGRRLPIALMGLLTVLATFGIAARVTRSPRAGILAALVVLSFPLLVLQSRMITSEIGTACGGSLIVYGLISLGAGRARGWRVVVDGLVAILAILGGAALGFLGGGMLLGLIVPVGAVAAASGLGAPAIGALGRLLGRGARAVVGKLRPRSLVGRPRPSETSGTDAWTTGELVVGAIATVAVVVLLGILASQIYEIRPPYPGMLPPGRTLLGKVIAPTGCWSDALGGIYKPEDLISEIFDSSFEQIAYGTFPWGILAPIAMAGLLRGDRAEQKLGALTLAWAGAAWIATEVFARKVGFSIWAGFPAMAVAIGGWLDHTFAQRRAALNTPPDDLDPDRASRLAPTLLVGLFVVLAVLDLGKDLQSFTERLTSLLLGNDAIPYPIASRLVMLPTRVWIFLLGLVVALGFAVSMIVWHPGSSPRDAWRRKIANRATAITFAGTVVVAAFWSFGWHPALAINLSSKTMFDQWHELRAPGDQLVVMGDLGDAPFDYGSADGGPEVELATSRDAIVKAIARPNRVFAIAPQTELCTLHREIGGKPYFVLDDRNVRSVLLSNRVDGATDRNPLAETILHAEPKAELIPQRPKAKVVWDNKIQLLGWNIPKSVPRGTKFDVTLYYKILAPVGGAWTSLMHFDGPTRFNGDHKPINDRCPTSTWQPGDYIIDTFTVTAGGATFPKTNYELWIG